MKITRFIKQFNPRFLLVRFLVNAIAVAITAAVTPKIYFVDKSVLSWLLITVMLGILNALIKPILQFLTLQFIFVTYGLVVVMVNTLILLLLSSLFPTRFAVDNLLWALVGGLVLGLVSSFLESLLGLTMPIVPDEPPELLHQLEEQARHVDWLATAKREAGPEEETLATEALATEALAIEPPDPDVKAGGSAVTEAAAAEAAAAEPAGAEPAAEEPASAEAAGAEPAAEEPSAPGPDEGPSPPAEVEAEPFDSVATSSAEAEAEVLASQSPELAPESREEQKEDRS